MILVQKFKSRDFSIINLRENVAENLASYVSRLADSKAP
jgi:vacuolar-type H+-ATPase subunit F/Vma7